MKGEFSRLTFDPRRHYSGVLWQQGRVGSDADWNEWVEAVLRRLQVETIDVIGQCGRPIHNAGFGITILNPGTPNPSIQISAGRLYAGGLLAELEQPVDFAAQTDWPFPSKAVWTALLPNGPAWPGLDLSGFTAGSRKDLFYAEVWLRHVTALNDEAGRDQAFSNAAGNPDWNARPEVGDFIRERALGGPDTCTRLQTVAQVKVWDAGEQRALDCASACVALELARPPGTAGLMQVNVPPTPPVQKPCEEPLTGGYGGAENRAYRVEIHDPGPAGTATFKWSNENGAFTLRVNATALTTVNAGVDIILQSIGNDQITQLRQNDWVEMCGEETELGLFRNNLVQVLNTPVAQPDGTWKVQLSGAVVAPQAPFLRRWSGPVRTIVLATPFDLDAGSGLSVSFFDTNGAAAGSTFFHDMDYWVWAARTLTRDIEPPGLAHTPQPTRGIQRHYCCLSLVTWTVTPGNAAGGFAITGSINTCDDLFPPLTELPVGDDGCCFCTITVGDGITSKGQYQSLPEAFTHIPDGGAIVCILPGNYTLDNALPIPKDNVILRGAGAETQITGVNGVFIANQRSKILITGLSMTSNTGPVIAVNSSRHVKITENQILLQENPRIPGLSVQGEDIVIERNAIRGAGRGGGGIHVKGKSTFVHIRKNFIGDGLLRGITLGSLLGTTDTMGVETLPGSTNLPADVPQPKSEGPLEAIEISDNTIVNMVLDAIGVPLVTFSASPLGALEVLSGIEGLRITDNIMRRCWLSTSDATGNFDSATLVPGVITLCDVEHLEIARNVIEDNGSRAPISGIFILLGLGVSILGNRLQRNGVGSQERSPSRGGVVIILALPPLSLKEAAAHEAWRAVSISDNLIEVSGAPPLVLLGAGPFSILANRMVRVGLSGNEVFPGSTVTVFNFGIGEDFAGFLGAANYAGAQILEGSQTNFILQALEALGGEVVFAQNQCCLSVGSESAVAASSILILSLDDLCFAQNQSRCQTSAGQAKKPFVALNSILFALSNRVEGNRFTETLLLGALASSFSGGSLVCGIGNQATHCMFFKSTQGAPGLAVGMNLVNPIFKNICERLGDSL